MWLVGPPGAGTSSLMRAGLLNAIRGGRPEGAASWETVVFRPGADPIESLVVALAGLPEFATNREALLDLRGSMLKDDQALHMTLRLARRGQSTARRTILFIDQFHEVNTLCGDEALRQAFLRNLDVLTRVAKNDTAVVIAARAAAMTGLQAYQGEVSEPAGTQVLVGPPTSDEMSRIIERPAHLVGLEFEPGLVSRLQLDLYRQPSVLPLLEQTLLQLWEQREGNRLSLRAYTEMGKAEGVLFALADSAYASFGPTDQKVARTVLMEIAANAGPDSTGWWDSAFKRVTAAGLDVQRILEVVWALIDARVLTTSGSGTGENKPDLVHPAHEALFKSWPTLLRWRAEQETARVAAEKKEGFVGPEVEQRGLERVLIPTATRPALAVHVVWHPKWDRGREVAERIYATFDRDLGDPLSRGLGIPVYFRGTAALGGPVPPQVDVDGADRVAVVVLLSGQMTAEAEAWAKYLRPMVEAAARSERRLMVVGVVSGRQMSSVASLAGLSNLLEIQETEDRWAARVCGVLAGRLVELLSEAAPAGRSRVSLFASHAKRDGRPLYEAIRAHVLANESPFDLVHDEIGPGERFDDWLGASLKDSVFLALLTDSYASRRHCRQEALWARRADRPMVVVDALQSEPTTGLPYFGSAAVIHWTGMNTQEMLDRAMLELLRFRYGVVRFRDLREAFDLADGVRHIGRPPEPIDWRGLIGEWGDEGPPVLVYPDPPMATEETRALAEVSPSARATTFTNADNSPFLRGRTIALSASEPEDLAGRGLSPLHYRAVLVELVRRVLSHGGTLVFGGDVRAAGFGEILLDHVRAFATHGGPGRGPLENYLAWPIYLDVDLESRYALLGVVGYHLVPPPTDLLAGLALDPTAPLPDDTPQNRVTNVYVRLRCLTAMREQVIASSDAMIVLGGRTRGYTGRFPGVAEEAYLALRAA